MSTTTDDMSITMLIGDEVIAVDAGATLRAVADALTGEDIGAVLVGSADDPQGVISERDLVHAVAEGLDLDGQPASSIANTTLVRVDVTASVAEVAGLMMDRWVRHVLVTDGTRLVGIVSARDLLSVYASSATVEAEEVGS